MASRIRIARNAVLTVTVPSIPVAIWYYEALKDREKHTDSVKNKIRIPNVQTVDDLLVEKCQPGDVILFDRRWDRCAAGPVAALSCLINRKLLSDDGDDTVFRTVESGKYDHCGLVVPGRGDKFDDVMLLESTSGGGIVARPLLTRLEMSRSRSVTLLPLSGPGERRNEDSEVPEKIVVMRERIAKELSQFRDVNERASKEQGYENIHSFTSIIGAVTYALGFKAWSPSPISPSAWMVVSGLQHCGVAQNITGREALEARVEDFLRDGRFQEENVVKLRPGWKFLRPVALRENSSS